eukprot:jgi/Ulvmu1/972/UM102_0056.1
MMSMKAVAGLAVLSQALALPMFYNDNLMGCTIPDTNYGAHSAPTVNEMITFELADATGPVTEWEPGMEYTLTVAAYAAATNAWIHSTDGKLTPSDATTHAEADCGEAVYSSEAQPSHVVTWTAPAMASGCVTVSSAQASGSSAGYDTNTVEVCPAGATGGPAPAAVAPVDGTVPEAEAPEGSVEDDLEDVGEEVEDVADDAGDAVEDTADDAVDTVTDTDTAVATSVKAVAALAAAGVLFAVM